ncbi:hypothetical protein [Ancylobacter sp.]|uniref:hypothetical protein n=1 Tax=Ancylobacter sp. TaxID=1872567 RepID=UPI003BAA5B1F
MTDLTALKELLERAGVRIKPLVWNDFSNDISIARSDLGVYVVIRGHDGRWFARREGINIQYPTPRVDGKIEAVEIARDHYERSALSALIAKEESNA